MSVDCGMGGRVALYRRRRGLSQKVVAELVGRSESSLSQVERGNPPAREPECRAQGWPRFCGSSPPFSPGRRSAWRRTAALLGGGRGTAPGDQQLRIPSGWAALRRRRGGSALAERPRNRHSGGVGDTSSVAVPRPRESPAHLARRAEIASERYEGDDRPRVRPPGGRISITPRPHAGDRGDPVRLGGRRQGNAGGAPRRAPPVNCPFRRIREVIPLNPGTSWSEVA